MTRRTERPMPVLLGPNYEHVMSQAVIYEEPDETRIVIMVKGDKAREVAGFVTAMDPVSLHFAGIPVVPHGNTPISKEKK